jgi:hypothetical protein
MFCVYSNVETASRTAGFWALADELSEARVPLVQFIEQNSWLSSYTVSRKLTVRPRSEPGATAGLVIEESTVRTHVKRILAKLALRDRVQIVIFAYETGVNRPAAESGPSR